MAIVVTSFAPTTAAIGQQVVITGTGLDTTKNVLVGNVQAVIVGTPTTTSLTFIVPAAALGSDPLRLLDSTTGDVTATGGLTVTAASSTGSLASTSAKKWRVDVWNGSAYIQVRAMNNLTTGVATNTVDDSDYDSGFWGSTTKTGGTWSLQATLWRKKDTTAHVYDPGQEILRLQQDQIPGTVLVQWYDRTGGPEAYQGTGSVDWAPSGGGTQNLDAVQVTINGQGARVTITNPVIATPALAGTFTP